MSSHTISSGRMQFALTIDPTGSSIISTPVTLSFGGPFQSTGKGKLPKSDFTVSISADGHTGSLQVISTGTKGYISVAGNNYQLPASDFEQLESSFASVSNPAGSSGSGALGKLGIHPLGWLKDPEVVGTSTIGGNSVTEIRSKLNVPALLSDLATLLKHASDFGVSDSSVSSALSASEQAKIASEIKNPSIDVYTGTSDLTVRRMAMQLTLPVSGDVSTLLGGLSSAGISLSLNYSDLNQPQTVTAPTEIKPYSQFQAELKEIIAAVEEAMLEGSTSSLGGSGSSTTSAGASSSSVNSYSQCITKAGTDATKMQKCASLLGSG